MANGYSGRVLRVNLSTEELAIETPGELFYRKYLGGWGFVSYYLLKELKPGVDALGSENIMVFATGVFTGAQLTGSGRSAVGAKSPVTGGFGEAEVGGFFGAELARAGWDAVVVTGKAARPVIITIIDDQVAIKDASAMWGLDTVETENALKGELGESGMRFAVIGRAGEKQVVFACVMNDLHHAAGRTGMGAVMGAKNLKAIAVKGSGRKEVNDAKALQEITRTWLMGNGKANYEGLQAHGTDGGLLSMSHVGMLPTRNFELGSFDGAEKITGTTMTDTILVDRLTCYACVIQCKRVVEVKEGPFQTDPAYGGPEYETSAAFGSNCGIDDLAAIAKANEICNAQGLDTISAGVMVSFAMECFERGIIAEKDTGGLRLKYGNAEAMVKLVEMIAERQGVGDLLAQGYQACIAKWGPESAKYAMHVKWQPFPLHDPRAKFGMGLGYAISPTGADHMHNIHDSMYMNAEGVKALQAFGIVEPLPSDDLSASKVRMVYYYVQYMVLKNMLGMCAFPPFGPTMTVDIVRAVTGWDTSLFELMKLGERGMAMARAFNAREGLVAEDDKLPDRCFEQFPSGPLKGTSQGRKAFADALRLFYGMAGWDPEDGGPTSARCAELDLDWVVADMRLHGLLRP